MNIYTEFEKELLERIGNIESRLESIERMLGDQEEDCTVVDRKEAMDKLDELLSRPDPILEPEWRPMSTAPKDRDIEVKVRGEVYTAWYYGKEEWNVSACILHEVYISGWRPL